MFWLCCCCCCYLCKSIICMIMIMMMSLIYPALLVKWIDFSYFVVICCTNWMIVFHSMFHFKFRFFFSQLLWNRRIVFQTHNHLHLQTRAYYLCCIEIELDFGFKMTNIMSNCCFFLLFFSLSKYFRHNSPSTV